MNHIICVYWGTKYPLKYVNILHNMAKRNMSLPFQFNVLTDNTDQQFNKDINIIPLPKPPLQHWWNKMHLYNPEIGLQGNILYIDLDTVIINKLDDFFTFGKDEDFCVIKDFGQPSTTINSSVLRYNLKHHSHIWKTYIDRKSNFDTLHGDQNVITDLMFNHKQKVYFPDDWTYSYKWPERGKPDKYEKYKPEKYDKIKPNSKICVFHGHPNPADVIEHNPKSWVKEKWQ